MLNNYGDTGSGFGGHGQPSAPLPRSMEHSKQQNVAPGWGYNTQLDGLYTCYPNEPQPMYNIHSMGHFDSSGKHNNSHYPQYPTGAMHQPVPTPVVKCHEACCQNLSDHSRYPVNPAPLRYPPSVTVQPPRYGDISNSDHRQYFQDRRGLQSSVARKKDFQTDAGFTGVHHDRHFSQCVGRGQIHVPESRQSMQVMRSQYPMYPINSYWSPRSWTGPRVNYPPPPPYHQSVSSQSAQLQSGIKMPDPPHYMEPNMQKQLGNQQRRAAIRNGTTEVVRPVPENKRPAIDGNHIQSCYDFPYTSGFVPFNEVSKMTSNSISQIANTSCKISNDKQFQHQMQYAVQNNDRMVSGCNDPLGDISYSMNFPIPNGESYMRPPVEGAEQISATRKLSMQYEQPSVGKKRPDLDVRQFLATWEDDEEENPRMSEPPTNPNNGAPYIVVDYRSLDNESTAKTQERLKPSGAQVCSSKPQNSPGRDNKRQTSEDVNSREKENQRSVIHGEYISQNSFLQPTAPTAHNDMEKNINFWGPNSRENCPVSEAVMTKGVFQPLDCSKRDSLNIVEPIMPPKRDSHIHGDMSSHKMMGSDSNHISFDALVTYYGDSRRGSDGSYDLVEMTERLVNAADKICTSERNPLEQQLPADIMGCNEMRVHHQSQIGVNPNSFHNRMPPHYASNTFQHFKQSVPTDGFFNLKQPVAHSKYFGIDQTQMMEPGSFEFHKIPAEFENQRTYSTKDSSSTTKVQEGIISKDGSKACLQGNKKSMYNESLRNPEVDASKQSHGKESLEFVGVDPEQFITPIIIKKSDYCSKECDKIKDTTKDKNSQMETEVIKEKTIYTTGVERTVLISPNDLGAEVFKVPYSPDKKQFSQKDNVVTLHSGDNTKCNTVTVEVPYVQQYSNLVKLSEEMTQADNIPESKSYTSSEVQCNASNNTGNTSGPSANIKNKTDESKRTTSLKLKRLPNSKEWIKIDEKIRSAQNSDCVHEKSENHSKKDSTSDSIGNSPARVSNLNMPSLDDIQDSSHIETTSEAQRVAPTETRVTSNYSSRSRHNDGINSENMSVPQLAIVSPLKFASDGKDENGTAVQSNIKQQKDNYFQTDKQFFTNNTNAQNYEDTPNNSCLQHEIENQFQQVHSPYNTLYLSQKQNLVHSGHSSSVKHFSDVQYLADNNNEKHENFKSQKKIQRVESFQQTISTDMSENNQQILKSKDSHKEQFSTFYSGRDITSHISPFNLSNRLITNEKDLDHHIPTSPGVDEMFEDINNPGHESLFQNKTDNLPDLTENSSFTLASSCQTGNSFDSFFEQGSSVEGNRPSGNVKRSEGITLNQSKTPDDGNRSNCCIIMKNSNVKSLSCETLRSENEEALPVTLSAKVNSPKSTWNLSQKRENGQENNICSEHVPAEGSTDFGTLSSSEPVSASGKDFINESLHSFEYVHTSVLQEMSLNNSVTDSSSELIVDPDKCEGKETILTKETEPKTENKSKYSSNSNVDSALKVADEQERVNCNSEKISDNSDFRVEYEVNASNENDSGEKCITKLKSLDNVLSTKSDENIAGNQPDEQWKASRNCSPKNYSESGKTENVIIQTAVSSLETISVDSEKMTLDEKFNTNEDTESNMGKTNCSKQDCVELAEEKKSENACEELHDVLCSENELEISSEKIQDKIAEENVKCKTDSDNCHSSVIDNQTNLTGSVHSDDCHEKSQTVVESLGNCMPVKNNTHSLHSTNETVKNGDQRDQEVLELTVNKFVEPCRGIVNETDDDENVVEADSEFVKCENITANENIIEDNNVSEYKESNEAKPVSDIHYEERCNAHENMQRHIEQDAVIDKTGIEKNQSTYDDASEATVITHTTNEYGNVIGCESALPANETESDEERSRYCVLDNDSKGESDNIDSTLNDKNIKEIEENHNFDSEKRNNNKPDRESLNKVTDETELVALECAEKEQSDQIEECSVQEMYDELAKRRKLENEIVITKTRTEYKNSVKCNSLMGSKIAVVSPLQSAEKHSDNIGVNLDNTDRSEENKDCFQDHCSAVLKMMRTNKRNSDGQEEEEAKHNEVVETISNLTVEYTDDSESATNARQEKIISDNSTKTDACTSLSEHLDTSITKCNLLDVQIEYMHDQISPLKALSECEHQNDRAFNFSCGETVVDLSSGTIRKEIREDLKDTKHQNSTEDNSDCNLEPNVCDNSECNLEPNVCDALEDGEQKDKDQTIDHEKCVNEEQYSACKISDHLDIVENKMQVESNFDSVSNLENKICSDTSESCIEHNQSVLDVKTSSEFISTDFTYGESDKENEYDTKIIDTELCIENKSVSNNREVVTGNEDLTSERSVITDARAEDTVLYGETNVISCIKNTVRENSEPNETCGVSDNNLHSSEASLPNETSCSYLCTSGDVTREDSNKHIYTTRVINNDVKKCVDRTGDSSTTDNLQCVTENPLLKELSMNKIESEEQHNEHTVLNSETTDYVLKLENTAVQPQNSHLIAGKGKLLTENIKHDSENGCYVEHSTLNKEDAFENKNETQAELRELPVESKEKNQSVTSLENITVPSGSNRAVSNTVYKNVHKRTSFSLHGDILTGTENDLCDPCQYNSVCHNSDADKTYFPVFEGAYHNKCMSESRGREQEDLRNLNHNDNDESCVPSGDYKIRRDSEEIIIQNVDLTPNVAEIENDNQVMDLSCNLAKESWHDGTNFEKVHHEGMKKTDSDDFKAREVCVERIVDCTSTSSSDNHENISETVDSQYGKRTPDGVISRDDGLSPSVETNYKTDKSVHNSFSDTVDMDCSEGVSAETEHEVDYLKTDASCEDEVSDSQCIDSVKGRHEIYGLQNKTIKPCGFGFKDHLKNEINKKCTTKYLPINSPPCSLNGPNNTNCKYVSCGLNTCISDNALVEDHLFEKDNEKGGNEIFHKSPSEHQSSINSEHLSHPEKHTDFSDNNSNIVNLENTTVGETNNLQLPDTSVPVRHCDSVQENDQKISGLVNTYSADNCVIETTEIDSVSTHNENSLCYKPVQSDYTIKESCEVVDNESVLDEDTHSLQDNTLSSGSKDEVATPHNMVEPFNDENSVESLPGDSQKENCNNSDKNHVSLQIPKNCMPSVVRSKMGIFDFNQSELANNMCSDSSEDTVNEDKIELNINENEANANTENESAVISDQKFNGSGISTDMCLNTFEPENLYINQIHSLDYNQDSPVSIEKRCMEDSLLENIDRVRNSLTLNGNNNFEKLVDPYEFQSSVYTGEQKDILTSKNISVFQHVSTSNDISIKSEILSNITNIPSKESCPLQCLVEAALALETAIVNKISQENTDSIQNSSHVVKCKNFYSDNLLNEDCKNVINNSTVGTVQSLDSSCETDYEFIHSPLNSQLHQTRNEEVRCNESSLDDKNVSSSKYFVPKCKRIKCIKQKEKRKTKRKYKKNFMPRLKRSTSVVDSRSKSDDTYNGNDSVTKEKEQFVEHTHDNSKGSNIDIRFPCDSDNLYCKTRSLGNISDEHREQFLASSVPSEDNKSSQETICMQNETGDNGCTQRDFIIPDQSVVCFQVTSDKMDEYMNQISNLSDIEVITESTVNNNLSITKSVGNKSCLDGFPKIPDVELENEASLVIIIEEIGNTCERLPDKKGNVSSEENFEHVDDANMKQSVEDKDCSSCADYFLLTTKEENSSSYTSLHNENTGNEQLAVLQRDVQGEENLKSKSVKNLFDKSDEQKLDHCCATTESYEQINENLVNDISNWPFLEEEIALDEQNGSCKKTEPKKQPYHLKCSLPWERIFNISNSRKRKTSRSKQETNVGLELGPAKVEVRIGSESGVWKVVNNSHNDYTSPVVKVKRLILQRDPDLTSSYSEKESEEENDIREKRKNSLSQSSDDSVPKVVIKKKSTSEYTSFLRLSDDEKWQPVVMLTRNKELDELILREKHTASSSPCDNNYVDASESSNLESQQLDIYDFTYENESTEETKLKGTTGNKMFSDISNCTFKNAIKKRPFKRRFKFGKSKEKKKENLFNKSNTCINSLSVEKRVFSDGEESSGSNKESDYSPACPVDASQEFAWQCIEKNGGESPETDSLSKDCGINCLLSQEETTAENEDNTNFVDEASDSKEFSNADVRNSPEVNEDTVPLINCAASIEMQNSSFLCNSDNTLSKDDCVSVKCCDIDINQSLKSSAEESNEEVQLCNLTVSDEVNSADIAPKECELNVQETVNKSSSDDRLNLNQSELENLASKNEIDPKQSCSTDIASDIQILRSINDSCVQSSQHTNSFLSKSVRDLIVEKPPSENRDRGLKRPSEGHSREDTKRRRYSIKRYPLECHKCHIGFEDKEELMRHKKSRHTPRELHHCLLCQRSFSSSLRYSLHVQGRSHRHIDLVQRYTMHTMHRLITGTDYPHLRPLTKSELQALDWRPSHLGCNHYYHQPTPLQVALQEHSKGDNKIAVNHT